MPEKKHKVLLVHNYYQIPGGEDTVVENEKPHTLYAKWKANEYTVNFNPNGNSAAVSVVSKVVTFNEKYGELPIPTRTGYKFDGWFTQSTGGNLITADSSYTNAGEYTLYAHWKANTYSVEYNANGGSGSMASSTHTYDVSQNLSKNAFRSPTGYSFNGWTDGSGNKYNDGQSVRNLSSKNGDKIILYAQWKANSYTVTFNANGGNVSQNSQIVTYNGTYGNLPTPTRTNYKFDGWYTAASGGTVVTSSTKVNTASNQTLYAHWLPLVTSITLSPNTTQTIGVGDTLSVSATVTPGSAYNPNIEWISSNTSIATVSGDGKSATVVGKAAGTVTITAKAKDGSGKSASITVVVKNVMYGYDLSQGYITFNDCFYSTYIDPNNNADIGITFRTKNSVGNGMLFNSLKEKNQYIYVMIENNRIKVYSSDGGASREVVMEVEYDLKPNTTYTFALQPSSNWNVDRLAGFWLKENEQYVVGSDTNVSIGTVNKFKHEFYGATYVGRCTDAAETRYCKTESAADVYLIKISGHFLICNSMNSVMYESWFEKNGAVNNMQGTIGLSNSSAIKKILY